MIDARYTFLRQMQKREAIHWTFNKGMMLFLLSMVTLACVAVMLIEPPFDLTPPPEPPPGVAGAVWEPIRWDRLRGMGLTFGIVALLWTPLILEYRGAHGKLERLLRKLGPFHDVAQEIEADFAGRALTSSPFQQGRSWFCYVYEDVALAWPLFEIVWAYDVYDKLVLCMRNGQFVELALAGHATQGIARAMPWIPVGYNEALSQSWRHDRADFVALVNRAFEQGAAFADICPPPMASNLSSSNAARPDFAATVDREQRASLPPASPSGARPSTSAQDVNAPGSAATTWSVLTGIAVTIGAIAGVAIWAGDRSAPTTSPYMTGTENHDDLASVGLTNLVAPPAPYVQGEVFRDCPECPEMIALQGAQFTMGLPTTEAERLENEGPLRRVAVRPFAVGKFEVTFAEWAAFELATHRTDPESDCYTGVLISGSVRAGSWRNPGYETQDNFPVACVSWEDAQEYVVWLSQHTKQSYRLLTEAEWEYAARAGTTTPYWTGDSIAPSQAEVFSQTRAVGSHAANGFGLYDTSGNMWEWTQDCAGASYAGHSADGVAYAAANCQSRMLRGGAASGPAYEFRSARRQADTQTGRSFANGFRVARSL